MRGAQAGDAAAAAANYQNGLAVTALPSAGLITRKHRFETPLNTEIFVCLGAFQIKNFFRALELFWGLLGMLTFFELPLGVLSLRDPCGGETAAAAVPLCTQLSPVRL